jgi:CBS domain-containing protein
MPTVRSQKSEDAMKVQDVMSRDVDLIDPSVRLAEAARIMREDDVGALPIGENDRLVGMLTDRDIVVRGVAEGRDVAATTARDVMSKGILYCFDDQSVEEAADLMGKQQVRRLAVVNREKRLVGIVSLGDLSTRASPDVAAETLQDVSRPAH